MAQRKHEKKSQDPDSLIAKLRDMQARLSAGQPLTPVQSRILAQGFERYLAAIDEGGEASFDRALGLRTWGGVSPARKDALFRRDHMLRQLRREIPLWRELHAYAASREMKLDADRYESNRWPREREWLDAPAAEPAATWWRILSAGLAIPDTKRLQQILNTEIQDGV